MADIIPFKGIIYNQDKIKDLNRVVTPPYDIITPDEQEKFYVRDEYNIIRLDLGREYPEDTESNNRYTRAADYLSRWLSEQVLIVDSVPSLYFYELIYPVREGAHKVMKGFIGLCRLEDFGSGKIIPHEYTLSKPKSDRLNLLRVCRTNFSLIFSLYSSPDRKINGSIEKSIGSAVPRIDILDDNNIRHRLWAVADHKVIDLVKREMKEKTIYIADGHHRYEASLNYRRELREKGGASRDENIYNYVMMFFANMDEPGLTVLPTHRLLYNLPASKIEGVIDRLDKSFLLRHFNFSQGGELMTRQQLLGAMEKATLREHLIGIYIHGDNRYILLSLKDEALLQNRLDSKPLAWRRLDVAILQSLILEDILGFSEEDLKRHENISYIKDVDEALRRVYAGEYQVAFLLNPTKIEEIKEVTRTGERMPQKSTYFYPKVLTGLVMYKF